jgi:YesN/AraC family two-component response regulator
VLAAIDGAEALQVFEKNLPDLVIRGITIPKMDGFEVFTEYPKTGAKSWRLVVSMDGMAGRMLPMHCGR